MDNYEFRVIFYASCYHSHKKFSVEKPKTCDDFKHWLACSFWESDAAAARSTSAALAV
jgi:hypothetical protein